MSGLIDFDAASDSADGDGVRGAGSNAHSEDGVSTHSDNGSCVFLSPRSLFYLLTILQADLECC